MKMKKRKIKRDLSCYKLTRMDLNRMAWQGLISEKTRDTVILASRLRKPYQLAVGLFQIPLNRTGSIILSSITENGGESINNPYHFLAEITHTLHPITFKKYCKWFDVPLNSFKK